MTLLTFQDVSERQIDFIQKEWNYYKEKLFQENCSFNEIIFNITLNDELKDNIYLKIESDSCYLQGNSSCALLIAFYRFLTELGIVFVRPGKKHEVFPTALKIPHSLIIDETASFKHRGVCIEGGNSLENVVDFIDWLPKIGMNSFFVQFENPHTFLARWYNHLNNSYLTKEVFTSDLSDEMSDLIDKEIRSRGLVHHRVGHGWTGEVLGYPSKYGWDENVALNSELKSLVAELNGVRDLVSGVPIFTNLCMSNPEAIQRFVEVVLNYAKKRSDVDVLHVWLSDAVNTVCECEACQKENFSDQYVHLLNEIDKAMTKEGIDTKICFLLYIELLYPPLSEYIKNQERFIMMFAPITRSFEESYQDLDYQLITSPQNKYIRNQLVIPKTLEGQLSFLKGWQNMFNGDSFVYDYPLGRAHYGDFGYVHISDLIAKDIKALDSMKLNGYISCQELRAGMPNNLPNYIMGQLLWNVHLDAEVIKQSYFRAMYGENYEKVLTYLSKLSHYSSCDYFNGKGERDHSQLAIRYEIMGNIADQFLSVLEEELPKHQGRQWCEWHLLGYHRQIVLGLSQACKEKCLGRNDRANWHWRNVSDMIKRNELYYQPYLDIYRIHEIVTNYVKL